MTARIMNTKTIGRIGEKIASAYLRSKGCSIVGRNFVFRSRKGPAIAEIDIIAKKGGCFVFVEVKTIATGAGYLAQDKVNQKKLWKISKAAEIWLVQNKIPLDAAWQIDVVAIEILNDSRPQFIRWLLGPKYKISHLKNVASC